MDRVGLGLWVFGDVEMGEGEEGCGRGNEYLTAILEAVGEGANCERGC